MTGRTMRLALSAVLCATLLPMNVSGQGKGKGHNRQQDDSDDQDSRRSKVQVIFSVHDREIIHDYYHGNTSNLPPGLAKRNGNLPPGLQKHLERDGTLPPGLQKRITPFPDDLERRLPRLPSGYRRVTLGVDVLILDRRTQRIMDIVHDVLRP